MAVERPGVDYVDKFYVIVYRVWQLRMPLLPQKFVDDFNNDLDETIQARRQDKTDETTARLKFKTNNTVWLTDGWSEFLNRNRLVGNYYMMFKYLGDNKFKVKATPYEAGTNGTRLQDRVEYYFPTTFSVTMAQWHLTRDSMEVPSAYASAFLPLDHYDYVLLVDQDGDEYVLDFDRGSQ